MLIISFKVYVRKVYIWTTEITPADIHFFIFILYMGWSQTGHRGEKGSSQTRPIPDKITPPTLLFPLKEGTTSQTLCMVHVSLT